MNILKKVLFVVLFLVLISVLKRVLDKYSPVTIIFHYNLLTCLQYFLLLGLFTWIIVQAVSWITRKKYVKTIYCVIIFMLALTGVEIYFYYMLRHAEKTSGRFHRMLVEYYLTYEINYPRLSYDPVLSYTLQPNSAYQHKNIEFTHPIRANKAGLRDDDSSLVKPDIICLGDSYTMGWGVDNKNSFAELIGQRTGLRVLNAGMTSYGTARELMLLNRLDTSNVKALILQYCYNDRDENAAFLQHNRYLPIGSQDALNNRFKGHELARAYFPFKYSLTILRMYLRSKLLTNAEGLDLYPLQRSTDYVNTDADAFLKVLYNSPLDFSKLDIYIIDMNRYPVFEHHLLDTVQNMLSKGNYSEDFIKSLNLVKFPELNNRRYFLSLDNHLTEDGHALIAEKIIEAMKNGRSQ